MLQVENLLCLEADCFFAFAEIRDLEKGIVQTDEFLVFGCYECGCDEPGFSASTFA